MPQTAPDSDPLKVETSLDLLIVLLYAPGSTGRFAESICGITRLQKLVFLLKQGEGPGSIVEAAKEILYKAYKMGPFSQELYSDIDLLKSLGFLQTKKLEYFIPDDEDKPDGVTEDDGSSQQSVESTEYALVGQGIRAGQELFEGLPRSDRDGLVKFKSFFNALPLRQLLIFVYKKYPNFTGESVIRGQLGL